MWHTAPQNTGSGDRVTNTHASIDHVADDLRNERWNFITPRASEGYEEPAFLENNRWCHVSCDGHIRSKETRTLRVVGGI